MSQAAHTLNPLEPIEKLATRKIAQLIVQAMRDADLATRWPLGERLIVAALEDARTLERVRR
jgi:hypothetical protein